MLELVNMLMESRIKSHIFHLQTKLYSAHMALGDFYENIEDLTDSIIEIYQGKYSIITGYNICVDDTSNPIYYLENMSSTIEMKRYEWVNQTETSLQNKIDEILELIYSTLYKLKNLR